MLLIELYSGTVVGWDTRDIHILKYPIRDIDGGVVFRSVDKEAGNGSFLKKQNMLFN